MANIKACFSSKTDDWATPQDFFDKLDKEFHFDLDPCADEHNHKCDGFDMPTSRADSLIQRLSCSFPQGQTPGISMSTFTERLKSAS